MILKKNSITKKETIPINSILSALVPVFNELTEYSIVDNVTLERNKKKEYFKIFDIFITI
ncbi:hypothetical protein B0A66_00470 [Flavobacterium hercynium]|uniref:Uncharacterized protein n=1 Tax=Flavobacterium hercynium TaxID=387094 RepID=A0A226HP40_9FLAO|nr:hypothetical protein B0A66_00470 [Flavobacterium hercynium]